MNSGVDFFVCLASDMIIREKKGRECSLLWFGLINCYHFFIDPLENATKHTCTHKIAEQGVTK